MKKYFLWTLLAITIFSVFGIVHAQNQYTIGESIEFFDAEIFVNSDNSVNVREKIIYNTGTRERHGIYRDIYPYSSQKRKMGIENIKVVDENGTPYVFETSKSGDYVRIKIGDPDLTFIGQKTYIIDYKATMAVAQFEEFDEIYWNVTGNGWDIPVYNVRAFVTLPSGSTILQSACYYGPEGSTSVCSSANYTDDTTVFNTISALYYNEGMTIAAAFPKNFVVPYSASDNALNFFYLYWRWMLGALLPILTFIFSLRYWYKKGRDPKGTGVIVPQYDVPHGLTPMEVGAIVNENINAKYISAEIIYLATLGYIRITELDKKFIGLIKLTDYELIKLKDYSDLPNDFDRHLLISLFKDDSGKVNLSDLKNNFYRDIFDITKKVSDGLLVKGYYKNLGRMKTGPAGIILLMFISVWVSAFLGGVIGGMFFGGNPLPIILGIFLSIIIYSIISHFNPAKTEKGVATKEYLLGLKDYLQIAEKDRLHFHNAPDKKPEVFEYLLPYAMVFGVVNIWAKEFEGIYTTPPSWYSGSTGAYFSAAAFSNDMSNFSSFASSSLSSSSGGSGSGGGGSSGGGGGGGGGGGW